MYDQEQQFTVFTWLNKNIHGIRVVPSEIDSLDWCSVERMWNHRRINVKYMIWHWECLVNTINLRFFKKYLNVFTQLDIQFQLDLFSSCFQVIYKCVSLCFFLYAFYFPSLYFKSSDSNIILWNTLWSFVCCYIISIRRDIWNTNIFNTILQFI